MKNSENKYGSGNYGRESCVFNNGGLGNIASSDDLPADLEYFFFLVPAFIDIKIDAQCGGQHGGSQILSIISCLFFRLTEGVMLADIPIRCLISRNGAADGSGQQSLRLISATTAHDAISHCAGDHFFQPLGL